MQCADWKTLTFGAGFWLFSFYIALTGKHKLWGRWFLDSMEKVRLMLKYAIPWKCVNVIDGVVSKENLNCVWLAFLL